MYEWRKMSDGERAEALARRKTKRYPWHTPPHRSGSGEYILTGACFDHEPHIAWSAERLDHFSQLLLDGLQPVVSQIYAWCVLPNHYHVVVRTRELKHALRALGLLHGRTSHAWNGEENRRGRKLWHACSDRQMRSYAHLMASINYVHHNPVKHGYVEQWQEWMWSSAQEFLVGMGRAGAVKMWRDYPILKYGEGWDD